MLPYHQDDSSSQSKRTCYAVEDYSNYLPQSSNQVIPQNLSISYSSEFTPELMQEYLQNKHKYQCSVSIFYPKAVQKSYTKEHRLDFRIILLGEI